jgi:WD40 repeat protein
MELKVEIPMTVAKLIKEHEAAIHRMNWSPKNANVLISGGHDGLINIYDISKDDNCLVHKIIRASGDAVRDVKFNPGNPDYFLAGTESGHFEVLRYE